MREKITPLDWPVISFHFEFAKDGSLIKQTIQHEDTFLMADPVSLEGGDFTATGPIFEEIETVDTRVEDAYD